MTSTRSAIQPLNGSRLPNVLSSGRLIGPGLVVLPLLCSAGIIIVLQARGVLSGLAALALLSLAAAGCVAGDLRLRQHAERNQDLSDESVLNDLRNAFGGDPGRYPEPFRIESETLSACLNDLETPEQVAGTACRLCAQNADFSDGLAASRVLFDVFMAHLPALAAVKDQDGRYLYVSAASRKLLHKSAEEMIGRTDDELWPAAVSSKIALADRQVIETRGVINTIEKVPVGGQARYHAITKFAIAQPGLDPFVGSITFDVTDKLQSEEEKVRLEEQLIQAQKMEAIGTLASGIAHDFNNILGAIFGYVELARIDSAYNDNVLSQLDQVLKAAQRARELVRQILTFSRRHELDRKPLDLKPLAAEALKLLRATLPATVAIRAELNNDGALVLADATQMHQVIMNLCTNASHAMEPNGGELVVGLNKVRVDRSDTGRGLAAGTYLALSVRDTGPGINAALKDRIFEPYFTTKAPGKGTGMGLAVVHGIVKSHGGTIDVQSHPGEGACFTVLMPVTEGVLQMPGVKIATLPRGTESVLFVDDEIFLADLGRQMLTRLGYRVVCSTSPVEALQLLHDDPGSFDLLITDMTMPHMTGEALIQQAAAIRHDLPVILCTGYSQKIKSEHAARLGIHAFLMKPLTIGDLAHTVRKVLNRAIQPASAAGGG